VNKTNDLIDVIKSYKVGEVDTSYCPDTLLVLADRLLVKSEKEDFAKDFAKKCCKLNIELFDPNIAASKIFKSLNL
jgi:hypothetical protein